MDRLRRVLLVAAALTVLGAAWLWELFYPIVATVIAAIPLESVKRAVRRFMDRLPPYPTLVVFLIPAVAHELMKAAAFWLFGTHRWFAGMALYVAADIVGLMLCAFIFEANRSKLLSIPWFNRCYLWFVAAHDWARAQAAPITASLRAILDEAGLGEGRAGLFARLRVLWRYARRRARAA